MMLGWFGHPTEQNHVRASAMVKAHDALNGVPNCDVTKILFLEYFNFGSGFWESILN